MNLGKNSCVFQNHSQAYVIDAPYMKKWKKSWNVIATSKSNDKTPIKFVSMLEYKKLSFLWGTISSRKSVIRMEINRNWTHTYISFNFKEII